jgi:hypothetical protein
LLIGVIGIALVLLFQQRDTQHYQNKDLAEVQALAVQIRGAVRSTNDLVKAVKADEQALAAGTSKEQQILALAGAAITQFDQQLKVICNALPGCAVQPFSIPSTASPHATPPASTTTAVSTTTTTAVVHGHRRLRG